MVDGMRVCTDPTVAIKEADATTGVIDNERACQGEESMGLASLHTYYSCSRLRNLLHRSSSQPQLSVPLPGFTRCTLHRHYRPALASKHHIKQTWQLQQR